MHHRWREVVYLLAVLVVAAAGTALAVITPDVARSAAGELAADVVAYGESHPGVAERVPIQPGAAARDAVLVHSYPDLVPLYYVVSLVDECDRIVSVIGVDALTGAWQWYAAARGSRPVVQVAASRADEIARDLARLEGSDSRPLALRIVMMPNKRLYWHVRLAGGEVMEVFVDARTAAVYTDRDKDEAGLTRPIDLAPAFAPIDRPERIASHGDLLFEDLSPAYDIDDVPYHEQITPWYCGEAALQMVFDYYGPYIGQHDIGDVANESPSYGTYATDVRRASHFSSISTAIQNPNLVGYNERDLGYTGLECWWSLPQHYPDRYDDLKRLISQDYPILILSWYDTGHTSGHFRVIKGYSDPLDVFIVHDPWYSGLYHGPDVYFNQALLVDNLWTQWDRWGLFSAPWEVDVHSSWGGELPDTFQICVRLTYPGPHPYEGLDLADSCRATVSVPNPFSFLDGSTEKTFDLGSGHASGWSVALPSLAVKVTTSTLGAGGFPPQIAVAVKGKITDSSHSYVTYKDWIGCECRYVSWPEFRFGIWEPALSSSSGPELVTALEASGAAATVIDSLSRVDLDRLTGLFTCLGMGPVNYIVYDGSEEAERIVSYIESCGNIYLEGGDAWYADPLIGGYDFGPLFSISATGDGSNDLFQVDGEAGTFTEGVVFQYAGGNTSVDHIEPGGSAVRIFVNPNDGAGCGVVYDSGTHRAVGSSYEFGGLADGVSPSTKAELMEGYLDFFAVDIPDVRLEVELQEKILLRGESLVYDAKAVNTTDQVQQIYFRADVVLPNGNPFAGNPVLGPVQVTMQPGQVRSVQMSHLIPQAAPYGDYQYRALLYRQQNEAVDARSFEFTIIEEW